jgi:hypothetical protein
MELQKVSVKFFVEQPNSVPLTEFIDVFHGWIQRTDGVYHDVADYSHMHAGPGIVLVGYDTHISIDESGNRRGLVYSQKSPLFGSNQEKLSAVIRSAMRYCFKLEEEPALRGKIRFAANEAVLSINDRRLGENSSESFERIKGFVTAVAKQLFGNAAFSVERDDDPRQCLNARIKTAAALDLRQAMNNL